MKRTLLLLENFVLKSKRRSNFVYLNILNINLIAIIFPQEMFKHQHHSKQLQPYGHRKM